MSEVKWIKIVVDLYNNQKIKWIRSLPNGYALFYVWVCLLCLAGDTNEGGGIYIARDTPYTDDMLAVEFNAPVEIIRAALKTFEQYGMIECDNGVIKIANWEKYQSVDKMTDLRGYNRQAKQRSRARVNDVSTECQPNVNQVSTSCQPNVNLMSTECQPSVNQMSTECQPCQDTDIDKDKDTDIDTDIEVDVDVDAEGEGDAEGGGTETVPASAACPYAKIKEMYHLLCPSFPTIKNIEGKRRQAVAARWREFPSLDTFAELFRAAEASDYLKRNVKTWARFDWLMTPTYFPRVLEHQYDDDYSTQQTQPQERPKAKQPEPGKLTIGEDSSFDMDELFTMSVKRSYGGIDPRETGITYGDNAGGAQ